MIYSDTSALMSMLIERENSIEINKALISARKKVIIWRFTDVELHCAMKSMVSNKDVDFTQATMDQALQELHYKEDINQIVRRVNVDLDEIFEIAIKITEKKGFKHRSLDTIHVASAITFKCIYFLSADKDQRELAKKEGLKLLPDKLKGE